MTTQRRLDCLIEYVDTLAERQGAAVSLAAQDVDVLKARCGFADHHEIGFYIRSLEKRGLVVSHCAGDNTILGAQITIDGYCHLDTLRD